MIHIIHMIFKYIFICIYTYIHAGYFVVYVSLYTFGSVYFWVHLHIGTYPYRLFGLGKVKSTLPRSIGRDFSLRALCHLFSLQTIGGLRCFGTFALLSTGRSERSSKAKILPTSPTL